MRYFVGFLIVYIVLGWFLVGGPSPDCTSEQRAQNPDACGVRALIGKSLLWPLELFGG